MKIHKEGHKILINKLIVLIGLNAAAFILLPGESSLLIILPSISVLLYLFFLQFFRAPSLKVPKDESMLYCPADGKIVVIEETEDKEYLKGKHIQVSIFMSIWDAHINWIPVPGTISYYKYHPGTYLVARNPKSSEKNERAVTAIKTTKGPEILLRQIAGAAARRVITYPQVNDQVQQNQQLGYIKFGSRVDILLPLDSKLHVGLGQKVKGNKDLLASLPE